jgi:hypothetical protein
MTQAQDPIGAPDEVWVTSSVGDTVYVGEEFEFQIHLANSGGVNGLLLQFGIESPESATWQWIEKPNGYGSTPYGDFYGFVTLVPETRWNGNFGLFEVGFYAYPEPGGPGMDSVAIGAVGFQDMMAPGPLQHMLSMHLKASHPGTICIDTVFIPPATSPWVFQPGGIIPAWNGPFCVTVVEPPAGDVNCDGVANIGDAVCLINWIFRGGSPPCH